MKKLLIILTVFFSVGLFAQSYSATGVNPDSIKIEKKITREDIICYIDSLSNDSTLIPALMEAYNLVLLTAPKKEDQPNTFDWLKWVLITLVPLLLTWVARLVPTNSKYGLKWLRWVEILADILKGIAKIVPNKAKGGGKF